jgi:hypothetical protein
MRVQRTLRGLVLREKVQAYQGDTDDQVPFQLRARLLAHFQHHDRVIISFVLENLSCLPAADLGTISRTLRQPQDAPDADISGP